MKKYFVFFLFFFLVFFPSAVNAESVFIPHASTFYVNLTVTHSACGTPVINQLVAIDVFDGEDKILLITDEAGSVYWAGNNASEILYVYALDDRRITLNTYAKMVVGLDLCEGTLTITGVK